MLRPSGWAGWGSGLKGQGPHPLLSWTWECSSRGEPNGTEIDGEVCHPHLPQEVSRVALQAAQGEAGKAGSVGRPETFPMGCVPWGGPLLFGTGRARSYSSLDPHRAALDQMVVGSDPVSQSSGPSTTGQMGQWFPGVT